MELANAVRGYNDLLIDLIGADNILADCDFKGLNKNDISAIIENIIKKIPKEYRSNKYRLGNHAKQFDDDFVQKLRQIKDKANFFEMTKSIEYLDNKEMKLIFFFQPTLAESAFLDYYSELQSDEV